MKQTIVETSYGEVMVKETEEKGYLGCYIGDNYDDYVGTVEGNIYDNNLADKVEEIL